tara:strand:+ start:535 stop:747 length:213 start_codon:yes stop_codon:yes gene_type:complete
MAFKMKGMRFHDTDSTMVEEAKREDVKMEEIKKQRGFEFKMINGKIVKVDLKGKVVEEVTTQIPKKKKKE